METATTEAEQSTLLDLGGKEISKNWIDENQPLFVPTKPLHIKAHKLQLIMGMLEIQLKNKPSAFNSNNYLAILNEWTRIITLIRDGKDEDVDTRKLAPGNTRSKDPAVLGDQAATGMDSGIQSEDPFAG